jgi:signal transduction histidine kinase
MLGQNLKTSFLISFLFVICLKTADAAGLPPQQAQDTIKKLLRTASKLSNEDLEGSLKAVNAAMVIAKESNLPKQLFHVYRLQGYILEQNSRLHDATVAYQEALGLQNAVNDSSKMDIFIDWAIINKKLGNYKISKEYYTYVLKIAEKLKDGQMMNYAYNGLATLHGLLSDFEKAIGYYHEAIKSVEKEGRKADLIAPYRNIALVYLKANNPVLALSNAEMSYKLALEAKDSAHIGGSLETLGIIYASSGKPELALEKDFEALKIMEKVGDKRMILDVLLQIADTYVQLNQLDKAEIYYKRCVVYKDFFEYLIHPNYYNKLANLYIKQGKKEEALSAFERSLDLATERGFKDLIQKNNLSLAQIYQHKGDFPNAYRCLETAQVYADSLFNEEKARNITQAQFMFDVERSEQKYKDLQIDQSRFWLMSALMLFSIITISLIYFLRQKSSNNKALYNKNAEIKLQNRRLEESNEILRQFAYASAHDLKEPLRSISSFTSIIKRRYIALLPPEADEYMSFVTTGVKRMESLLSALLEYSTIIADTNVTSSPIPIHSVLEDVTKNLHLIVSEKNGAIIYPPTMCSVRMSRLHMTQLFQNLIGNALKFTTKPPEIKVSAQSNRDEFLITIADNGIGINPDYGDKVFRLFQRLNKSVNYEGTGIGLTICKNIVEKYGGKIWFESQEGVGTTFFISLPPELVQPFVQNTEGGITVKRELLKA